jgi:hypothetical protein
MPCWVPVGFRDVPLSESEPATFIGSADILRRDLLGRALQAGADFTIRGPGWVNESQATVLKPADARPLSRLIANQLATVRNQGLTVLIRKIGNRVRPLRHVSIPASRICTAPIGDDEYFRITREAMVTIGVNRVPAPRASNHRPLAYSRLRDIEAPMLGACYLTERTEGLGSLFELGDEIETYGTAEELSGKLAELSKAPLRRMNMRKRAQRRALNDHSVGRSIDRISRHLGLAAER